MGRDRCCRGLVTCVDHIGSVVGDRAPGKLVVGLYVREGVGDEVADCL